jgi:hypothetical protein
MVCATNEGSAARDAADTRIGEAGAPSPAPAPELAAAGCTSASCDVVALSSLNF